MKNIHRIIVGGLGVGTMTALGVGTAVAATLGAGDEIQVDTDQGRAKCSVAAVGTVNGQKAALTAGHCHSGSPVYDSEGNEIGHFDYYKDTTSGLPLDFGKHDYAVIILNDDVETVGSTSAQGAEPRPITGLDTTTGFESFGKPVYKDGRTTGRTDGFIIYDTGHETIATPNAIWGDSGGSLVDGDGNLHGVTSRAVVAPFVPITAWSNADEAVADYKRETGKDFVIKEGDTAPHQAPSQDVPAAPAREPVMASGIVPQVPAPVIDNPVMTPQPPKAPVLPTPKVPQPVPMPQVPAPVNPAPQVPVPQAPAAPVNEAVTVVKDGYDLGSQTAHEALDAAEGYGADVTVPRAGLDQADALVVEVSGVFMN